MDTNWDYSYVLADYALRPPYAPPAIHSILEQANLSPKATICEIGAGYGRLTDSLARHGAQVIAIEPNDAIRAAGQPRTEIYGRVEWREGTGEETGLDDEEYDLVIYGSSFHTVDRITALNEAARILKKEGWFACLWNHRDLNDPLQGRIDEFLMTAIPGFAYGVRREDQTQILQDCGHFSKVQRLNFPFQDTQTIDEAMTHWRSHMTVARQAGEKFPQILAGIERILRATKKESIVVPYNTRVWIARKG